MRLLMNILSYLPSNLRQRIILRQYPLQEIPAGYIFKLADTTEERERERALQLFHMGSDQRSPQDEFYRSKWNNLPCTSILICKKDEDIVAAMSLIHDDGFGLPSDHYQNLGRLRNKGLRIMEIGGLSVRRKDMFLPLYRFAFDYARKIMKADGLIITTSKEFSEIYSALFRFRPLEVGKILRPEIPSSGEKVTQLLRFHGLEAGYLSISSEFHHYFFEKRFSEFHLPKRKYQISAGPLLSPEQFSHFFAGKSVIERLSEKEKFSLADTYDFCGLREHILGSRRPSYHRSSPRIPVRYKVSVINSDSSRIRYGEVHQIAVGGITLNIPNMDYVVGDEIMVTIDLEHSRVKVKGNVVWSGPNNAGVKLDSPSSSWRAINEYAWKELGMLREELRAA